MGHEISRTFGSFMLTSPNLRVHQVGLSISSFLSTKHFSLDFLARFGFFLPPNTACFKPGLQINFFDELQFSFCCCFFIVHQINTKLIGLVNQTLQVILISKNYILHNFCGRLDQIRLQKTDFLNLHCSQLFPICPNGPILVHTGLNRSKQVSTCQKGS